MQGDQIAQFMNMDWGTKSIWGGFVARDSQQLKDHRGKQDRLYVMNTDRSSGPGEHWCVGFLTSDGGMEFFDSYGCHPSMYGLDRLFPAPGLLLVNTRMVQDLNSLACGHHCLFFAYFRSRGIDMEKIISLYGDDTVENDRMVTDFVLQFGKVYSLNFDRKGRV